MNDYQKNRYIIEIPIPMHYKQHDDAHEKWMSQLNKIYFFSNQHEVFDCFLVKMNKEIFISYNVDLERSFDFTQFVLKTLPKNLKEKKRKFYKPSHLI